MGHYSLFPWCGNGNNGPTTFYIVGSNDGSTWNKLDYQNFPTNYWNSNNTNLTYFTVSNTTAYTYFRIVCQAYGVYYCALSQFNVGK